MEVHNTVEDIVITRVNEVFDAIEKDGNQGKLCTCDQCRMDVICYALNRTTPHYISSSRGASRVRWEGLEYQQLQADITSLVHDGLKKVNHNLRPHFDHGSDAGKAEDAAKFPAFNIPTIVGRIYNGENFEPLSGAKVELLVNGKQAAMKDQNWQNPLTMVQNTNGNFSFWPAPVKADKEGEHRIFEFSLKVEADNLETMNHFFKVAVQSEFQAAGSFNLQRTYKLPDLYMFPPGTEGEDNSY